MNFTTAVKTCFHKYADFQGRARRSEYWFYTLFNLITLVTQTIIGAIIGFSLRTGPTDPYMLIGAIFILVGLYWLAMIVPTLAVTVRRFHDLGVSGWFILLFFVLGLIPYVGWLASIGQLIWFCQRGTDGENKYGQDPYGYDPSEVFS